MKPSLPLLAVFLATACTAPAKRVELPASCDPSGSAILVLGEVRSPGRHGASLAGHQATVAGVLRDAGGFTPLAWKSGTTITRRTCGGPTVRVRVDVEAILEGDQRDVALSGGDIVHVPSRDRRRRDAGPALAGLIASGTQDEEAEEPFPWFASLAGADRQASVARQPRDVVAMASVRAPSHGRDAAGWHRCCSRYLRCRPRSARRRSQRSCSRGRCSPPRATWAV